MDEFIERRIITGMIVSTDYLRAVFTSWNPQFVLSSTAKIIAGWCVDYFKEYNQAPGRDIESILARKEKETLSESQAADIREILDGLSEEYTRKQFNVPYLVDESQLYFKEQSLRIHAQNIEGQLNAGEIAEAELIASSYIPPIKSDTSTVEPFKSMSDIKAAFAERQSPLIQFPGAIGNFWNSEFTRDSFIGLMAPEKRGKTFMLMEVAMCGLMSGCNVCFFQAGDMSKNQQIRRLCIYLTQRSDLKRYCGEMFIPIVDCTYNQINSCERAERESNFGPFEGYSEKDLEKIKHEMLVDAYRRAPNYKPCLNCNDIKGAAWFKLRPPVAPLQWKEAYKAATQFQRQQSKRFKLTTYASETLSVSEIKTLLDTWERQEGFIADLIVIDYADLLLSDPDCRKYDFRHQQNKIWQRLRGLSQQRHCSVVSATQAAASSYDKETMKLSDFSEDKRKFSHVTAMYALNQTEDEKRRGSMRVNEMIVRENEFYITNNVKVLQRLQIGRPMLGSYK